MQLNAAAAFKLSGTTRSNNSYQILSIMAAGLMALTGTLMTHLSGLYCTRLLGDDFPENLLAILCRSAN